MCRLDGDTIDNQLTSLSFSLFIYFSAFSHKKRIMTWFSHHKSIPFFYYTVVVFPVCNVVCSSITEPKLAYTCHYFSSSHQRVVVASIKCLGSPSHCHGFLLLLIWEERTTTSDVMLQRQNPRSTCRVLTISWISSSDLLSIIKPDLVFDLGGVKHREDNRVLFLEMLQL